MRISIDCRYVRERPSGIGAYTQALCRRVPALSPADSFHFWVDPRARRPLTTHGNVTEEVVRAPANSVPTLLWPSRLAQLGDVDVLHAPFNILGRGVRCPTVVTVHDLIWLENPTASEGCSLATPFQAIFYRDGILRALRRAARVVAISRATADDIARVEPAVRERVRVVLHGVEACYRPADDPERSRARAHDLLGSTARYVLVVGQNAPFKNHTGILEGFAAADLGPDVRLVLLQRLNPGGALARRARALGIFERVVWRTGLAQDDLLQLLRSALCLVQFSRFEGFGMPVAEAMACGTPVIASDIAALREVAGGAALHVPLQPAALGAALRRLAREPELCADLSARGIERARALSWERSAAEHLEVYREAAADPR
jgi:glycosyltransferase involved in cell wall biosynthesis